VWDAFGGHQPDLVIVLKDAWVLDRQAYRDYRTAVWLAFDTEPLGVPDRDFFAATNARAVCVSQAGQKMARAAGQEHGIAGLTGALCVPSGVDTQLLWTPGSREAARDLLGLPQGVFIAGICAANIGPRKAWGEQLAAFASFRRRHKDALLLIHAARQHEEGIDLEQLAEHLGIRDAVLFGAHTAMDDAQMANWFRSLDVLLAATYGEGFGLPIVQAQSCGVPVIGTRCSAISEKIPPGTGWLVRGQRWWNPHHQAWWTIPNVREITLALGKAARRQHAAPALIREHALAWDAATVMKEQWAPALDQLTEGV
jgi:glycosyltransferase involved in cell wall biosynthesis